MDSDNAQDRDFTTQVNIKFPFAITNNISGYLQTGGKNQSSIHWDLLANMRDGGEIYADDELIYKDGQFLFLS